MAILFYKDPVTGEDKEYTPVVRVPKELKDKINDNAAAIADNTAAIADNAAAVSSNVAAISELKTDLENKADIGHEHDTVVVSETEPVSEDTSLWIEPIDEETELVTGEDITISPDNDTSVADAIKENAQNIAAHFNTLTQQSQTISELKDDLNQLSMEKQDTLVSGTNIKTVNGESILGNGNINIQGGEGGYDDTEIRNNINELNSINGLTVLTRTFAYDNNEFLRFTVEKNKAYKVNVKSENIKVIAVFLYTEAGRYSYAYSAEPSSNAYSFVFNTNSESAYIKFYCGERFDTSKQAQYTACIIDVTDASNRKAKKRISIIGDSWSTFKDFIDPVSNAYWYPRSTGNDVAGVEDTWWHIVARENNMVIDTNNSYSGSPICNADAGSKAYSFITRMKNVGSPDILFIEGGTNDYNINAPVGEAKYADWVDSDFESFAPAVCYMFDYYKKRYPCTAVYFIMNPFIPAGYRNAVQSACSHYGFTYLQISTGVELGSSHPNIAGMRRIANTIRDALNN